MKDKVIVFDGVCGLCNKAVDILIRLDHDKVFRYTSLQGEYVKQLDIEDNIDSIIFCEKEKLYYKSTAIFKILTSLGGAWVFINIFYLIPRFLRDAIYDIIAKYRYKIFGKLDTCRIPTKTEAELFID